MQLLGTPAKPQLLGQELLPGKVNYVFGRDPKQWHTDVWTYRKVRYQGVYPGVDLVYYGNQKQLEYDFLVAPMADPSKITMRFVGAKRLTVGRSGDLTVELQADSVRWRKPVVYQEIGGKRRFIHGRFVLKGTDRVAFALARYDRHHPLVIDPVFAYSTYLGGSRQDDAYGIAVDDDGYVYVTGESKSPDFPGTNKANPYTAPWFVCKLDPTGSKLIYNFYNSNVEPKGITVDKSGQAYIVGTTPSPNMPVVRGAQATYPSGSNWAAFLMVINATGNSIVYSTYLGGSGTYITQSANAVTLGPDGTVYLAGATEAKDFPMVAPYQSASHTGLHEPTAFVARIDTTQSGPTSLLYSTYLGGNGGQAPNIYGGDIANGIAVDSSGRFYVAGYTQSTDFPTVSPYQTNPAKPPSSTRYAFLSAFVPDGSRLLYSTYFGGGSAYGVAVDDSQHAFITGETQTPDFPVRNALQSTFIGEIDGFVAEFDCAKTGDASLVYSTLLSSDRICRGCAIATDMWGNAYVTGEINKRGATGITPAENAFLLKLAPGSGKRLFAIGFGGPAICMGWAITVDQLGFAYVAGTANSLDFSVTPGAYQTQGVPADVPPGDIAWVEDAFISKLPTYTKLDFNGDQMSDLLFQSEADGRLLAWTMQGDRQTGATFLNPSQPGANWRVVGAADMNGDGATDLLFQNAVSGEIAYWFMSGTKATSIGTISPSYPGANWKVAGMADFNRDGYPDILFQNTLTGAIYVWYMRGTTRISGAYLATGYTRPDRKVVAVGDLNNDGQADILLQDTLVGQVEVLSMYRGTVISAAYLNPSSPGTGWNVVGMADIDGDGRPEVLFQNASSGQIAYWMMNGLVAVHIALTQPSGPGSAQWKLVGAN